VKLTRKPSARYNGCMRVLLVLVAIVGLLIPVAGCQRYDSALAPIDDVSIEIPSSAPLSGVIVSIKYGLPDSCYTFDRTRVVEISDGFDIGVWIKKPIGPVACAEIYRQQTTTVDLGRKFEPGKSYTIRVNGVERQITIPGEGGDGAMIIKPAPIVSVEVRSAESFPPQVFVDIRGVLTDGCTILNETKVQRQGNVIDITVTTQRPRDAVCVQVVSFFDTAVPLGSDFIAGQQYTLRVNGQAQQFNVGSSTGLTPVEPGGGIGGTPAPPR